MADSDSGDGREDESHEEIPLGRRTVLDGHRLSIPTQRLGVEQGDTIDALIQPVDPETEAFVSPDLVVKGRSSARITIPRDHWEQYDVDVGDKVDLDVRVPR